MASPTFGLVAEGPTDHKVLERLLAGAFDDRNIAVRPLQPLTDATGRGLQDSFGGWQNVLSYLASPNFEQALQDLDFLVVQIDTDVAQEYGVDTHHSGIPIPEDELISAVRTQLVSQIDPAAWIRIEHRVVFAIAISSIECWLLVLHGDLRDRSKTQNCLKHLNRTLARKNLQLLGSDAKDVRRYGELARDYAKPKTLEGARGINISLDRFTDQLQVIVNSPEKE